MLFLHSAVDIARPGQSVRNRPGIYAAHSAWEADHSRKLFTDICVYYRIKQHPRRLRPLGVLRTGSEERYRTERSLNLQEFINSLRLGLSTAQVPLLLLFILQVYLHTIICNV